jgi:hypothetical protein
MEDSKARLGQFFFFIGSILLIIFFSVDPGQNPQANLFISGIALAGFGIFLFWRGSKNPPQADRFRTLRRMKNRPKKEKGSKDKRKD